MAPLLIQNTYTLYNGFISAIKSRTLLSSSYGEGSSEKQHPPAALRAPWERQRLRESTPKEIQELESLRWLDAVLSPCQQLLRRRKNQVYWHLPFHWIILATWRGGIHCMGNSLSSIFPYPGPCTLERTLQLRWTQRRFNTGSNSYRL